MKAMIFAAGLGTRLKPYTDNCPKALIEINGIPMLEMVVLKLIHYKIKDIIVNVHHHSNQIIEFLKQKNNFGINIVISDESDELLDTGGGLKKASWFFDDKQPFLIYNTDILSNINIFKLLEYHNSSDSIATLAVKNRETSRYFLFDEKNILCGWNNTKTNDTIQNRFTSGALKKFAFSGVHILNPEIFKLFNNQKKFSITNEYVRLCETCKISGYVHNEDEWFDLGSMKNIEIAEKYSEISNLQQKSI